MLEEILRKGIYFDDSRESRAFDTLKPRSFLSGDSPRSSVRTFKQQERLQSAHSECVQRRRDYQDLRYGGREQEDCREGLPLS